MMEDEVPLRKLSVPCSHARLEDWRFGGQYAVSCLLFLMPETDHSCSIHNWVHYVWLDKLNNFLHLIGGLNCSFLYFATQIRSSLVVLRYCPSRASEKKFERAADTEEKLCNLYSITIYCNTNLSAARTQMSFL